jgi:hypothetical protein
MKSNPDLIEGAGSANQFGLRGSIQSSQVRLMYTENVWSKSFDLSRMNDEALKQDPPLVDLKVYAVFRPQGEINSIFRPTRGLFDRRASRLGSGFWRLKLAPARWLRGVLAAW